MSAFSHRFYKVIFFLSTILLLTLIFLGVSDQSEKSEEVGLINDQVSTQPNTKPEREKMTKLFEQLQLQDKYSNESVVAMDCAEIVFYESGTGKYKIDMPQNLSRGLEEISEVFSSDYEVIEFCKNVEDYYIAINDESRFPFKSSKALKGKTAISLVRIDQEGNMSVVHNIEEAVTDNFDELSFYFWCGDIVGLLDESTVLFSCGGSEGAEDVIGLIQVNTDLKTKNYISYCIDVVEKPGPPGVLYTDGIYTCYDKNRRIYYNGKIK